MNRLLLRFLLGLSVCLLFAQFLPAQRQQLVLQNAGRFKRDRIEVGQTIGVKMRGQDQMYFGQVQKVKSDMIYIFGDSITADSVERIHVEKPHYWPGLVRGAAATGMLIYPIMVILNNPLKSWTWKQPKQIAGIFAGGYLLQRFMKIFYWRRVNLDKGRWELKVMPTVDSYF